MTDKEIKLTEQVERLKVFINGLGPTNAGDIIILCECCKSCYSCRVRCNGDYDKWE